MDWSMKTVAGLGMLLGVCLGAMPGEASGQAMPMSAVGKLPVEEVTVFKDGHAFVLHEGEMPVDGNGNVVLDYLPTPVLGTFWPYSADPEVKLEGVVAGKHRIGVERTALTVRELLEANPGASALITENGKTYPATIVGFPTRTSEELARTDPYGEERLPERANLVLLRTHEGIKVVPVDRIQEVTFKDDPKRGLVREEFRNLLTLNLDWGGRAPAKTARVGLMYVQKGVRWIPSYKVALDGKGEAAVSLEATLLDELTDLEGVTMHLVVGVPTFQFKDTIDPISLQESAARLSRSFRQDAQTAFALSNAIMTQVDLGRRGSEEARPRAMDLGPDMPEGAASEDLFVFTIPDITLERGQRMVIPVAEFTLPYKDVYTLSVPLAPPPEVRMRFSTQQESELARLYALPKVMHGIRLVNEGAYPLTTAPALILEGGRVLAQSMMTYTPAGASVDLQITTAVDTRVRRTDVETEREENAAEWRRMGIHRIRLAGTITLTSYAEEPMEVEVIRHVLGNIDSADSEGQMEQVNVHEEGWYLEGGGRPYWWGWHSWPAWWYHFNGIGRVRWTVDLQPGKSVTLGYTYHYYWG